MGNPVIGPGGQIIELDDAQAADEAVHGGNLGVSQPQGDVAEAIQKQADQGLANAELSGGEKAWLGAFSGLSAGFGPAGLSKIMEGLGDKNAPLYRHLQRGANLTDAGTAGQVAGMVGGGLAGGAVLDEVGAAMRIGALLPEASGLIGQTVRGAAAGAGRAGFEGSILGLGAATEEAALTNRKLSAEAIMTRMGEGALVGGGIGAVFGAAGGLAKGVLGGGNGAVSSALGRAVGKDASSLGLLREMGANGSALREIGSMEGGMPGFMERAEAGLQQEGLRLSSSPAEIKAAAQRLESNSAKLKIDVAKQFDRVASSSAPSWSSFVDRVKAEVVGDLAMGNAPGALEMAEKLNKWLDRAAPANGGKNPMGHSFEAWVKGRSLFSEVPGMPEKYAQQIRQVYDEELRGAMMKAEVFAPELKGASGRYQAMELTQKTAEILQTMADYKNSINAARGVVRGDDLGAAAAYAMAGNPVGGLGYAGGRVVMRTLAEKYGPAMAEAVYKMSVGTKATGAISELGSEIGSALGTFMKARNNAAVGTFVSARERGKFTRENYDKEIDKVYKLVNASPEEREQTYFKVTGSKELASAMAEVSARAAGYLGPKIPASQKVKQGVSLRSITKSVVISPEEHKFLKSWGIAKAGPLAALEDLKKGQLSKDSVDALKAMWPESYQMIVSQAQTQVAEMKARGETMDMGRITQLSILLGAPLDRTLEKSFIEPVQLALAEPPAPPPAPAPGPTPDGSSEEYKTTAEEAMS